MSVIYCTFPSSDIALYSPSVPAIFFNFLVLSISLFVNTYSLPSFISTVGIAIGIFKSFKYFIPFNLAHSSIASSIASPETKPVPNILLVDLNPVNKYLGSAFNILLAKYFTSLKISSVLYPIAYKTAIALPILVPAMASIFMLFSSKARSTPI